MQGTAAQQSFYYLICGAQISPLILTDMPSQAFDRLMPLKVCRYWFHRQNLERHAFRALLKKLRESSVKPREGREGPREGPREAT